MLIGVGVASGAVAASANTVAAQGARIESTGLALVQAKGNASYSDVTANAADLMWVAGGNMTLTRATVQTSAETRLDAQGALTVQGGSIKATGNAVLSSGGDLLMEPVKVEATTNDGIVNAVIRAEWGAGCQIGGVTITGSLRLETSVEAVRTGPLDLSGIQPEPPIDEDGEEVDPAVPEESEKI